MAKELASPKEHNEPLFTTTALKSYKIPPAAQNPGIVRCTSVHLTQVLVKHIGTAWVLPRKHLHYLQVPNHILPHLIILAAGRQHMVCAAYRKRHLPSRRCPPAALQQVLFIDEAGEAGKSLFVETERNRITVPQNEANNCILAVKVYNLRSQMIDPFLSHLSLNWLLQDFKFSEHPYLPSQASVHNGQPRYCTPHKCAV